MTEGGGERVIECGKTGGYGRAEGGEGRDELLFGVVVLVEEGDGVKVVLLLLTTSFLLSVIIVPPSSSSSFSDASLAVFPCLAGGGAE